MSRSSNRIVVLTTAVWVAGMAGALVWLLWPTPRTPLPRGWRHWPETGKAVAVQLASDGVYVGGPHGLFHVADDNALSRIAIPDVPDAVMIYSLLVDREGRLWVGHNHGLSVRIDTHWQTFTAADVLPGVPVNALMQSRDGTIWLGTPKGALHLPGAPPWDDATGIRRLTRKDGLLEDVVFCLLEDAEGGIWFGNYIAPAGGLNRLKDGHWQHWTPRDGLPHADVTSLMLDANGRVWAGCGLFKRGGAAVFAGDGDAWRLLHVLPADELAGPKVRSLFQDRDGRIWLGSEYDGLTIRSEHRTLGIVTTDDGLPHNEVMSMAQRPDGAMWLGTAGGLLRIEAEAVQMLLKRPERP